MHNSLAGERSKNITKTWTLMGVFLLLIVGIGFLLAQYTGSATYLYGSIIMSLGMNLFAYFQSDKIALRSARAQPADPHEYADLHSIVEKLAIDIKIPKPAVYIIHDPAPNAFATGRDPKHASVAATTGLLQRLTKDELTGVFAHELSHVNNRDILVMTVAVVLTSFVSILANMFIHTSMMRSNNKENSGGAVVAIATVLALIVAPIAAQLLQLAVSRKREFLADASGALVTNHPEHLASALEKIADFKAPMQSASYTTAHLFISNPFGAHVAGKFLARLFATHPPIEERISILRTNA
jgi:heat shock protein HtpX